MRLLLTFLVLATTCGCASKATKQKQAEAAYRLGQQRAYEQIMESQRINIRLLGPVQNAEVQWTDGLTLVQAIVAAKYTAAGTPGQILIIRRQERIPVEPQALLRGEDFGLEPGDTIEISP
jgi:hypothetical protein